MKFRFKLFSVLILSSVLSITQGIAAASPIPDVRVLIDISGSMKKSDPENLRIPATRLIAGLMPEGSRSGVWTFGRYVNMLVPVRPVNGEWRELAKEKSELINSAGLYTNIEGVLENASSGWFDPDPYASRNIILLSDGYVDVSKDAEESAASRKRIINNTLPRLSKAGVVVHTVALSDDADHQLLETISVATKGSYLKAGQADELNRLFLKLFEKSADAPSLPLRDNKFKVDSSIKNMTLVIMQGDDAKPAEVILPDGSIYSEVSHPDTVKWHHEKGFDLVSIDSPNSGQWRIDANIDPDNRVIVATNIELDVSPIPNMILPNELVHISGSMLENSKPLIRREILDSISMTMLQEQHDGTAQSIKLGDDGIPPDLGVGDGVFSGMMNSPEVQGIYEVSVIASSPTFEREYRHTLQVMGEPIETKVTELGEEKGGVFLLTLSPRIDQSILKIDSLTVKLAGSEQPPIELPRDTASDTWHFELPSKVSGKNLTFYAKGSFEGGRDMTYEWNVAMPGATPEPAVITEVIKEMPPAVESVPEVKEAVEEVVVSPELAETPLGEENIVAEPAEVEAEEEGTNWGLVIGIIVGINLLFAIGGGAWWWLSRRKKTKSGDAELEIDDVTSSADSQAKEGVLDAESEADEAAENSSPENSDQSEINQDAVLEEVEKAEATESEEASPDDESASESESVNEVPEADKVA